MLFFLPPLLCARMMADQLLCRTPCQFSRKRASIIVPTITLPIAGQSLTTDFSFAETSPAHTKTSPKPPKTRPTVSILPIHRITATYPPRIHHANTLIIASASPHVSAEWIPLHPPSRRPHAEMCGHPVTAACSTPKRHPSARHAAQTGSRRRSRSR